MTDRWLLGVSEQGNLFLVRRVTPRFSARVLGPDQLDALEEDDTARGKRHVLPYGRILADFDWLDPEPGESMLAHILAEAEDAFSYLSALYSPLILLDI